MENDRYLKITELIIEATTCYEGEEQGVMRAYNWGKLARLSGERLRKASGMDEMDLGCMNDEYGSAR